jgi:acetoin utilization protein AcuB
MKIRQIMHSSVITTRPDDPLATALQLMVWSGVHHLPVLDGEALVGLLSERDILRFRAECGDDRPLARPVLDAMSAPAHYAAPDDSVGEVAGRMADDYLGAMPILDHGRLVGIVTTTDILKSSERQQFPH